MTRSMTGFGRSAIELNGERVTIEVSSVNHRFLESSFRLPSVWAALEPFLRESVRLQAARGKLYINVRREHGPMGRMKVSFDAEVAERYIAACRELAHRMNSTESVSLNTLATLEGVFYQEEDEKDLEEVKEALIRGLNEALAQLNTARAAEGMALAQDIALRVTEMRDALDVIERMIPEIEKAYEERLRARVVELTQDITLREDRVAVEVALLADKNAIHEEVVRLKTHLDHVGELLASNEPVGRELNFLAQEIQREANTLGSKLRDVGVIREVLKIKSELEKLREQAQNVE